MDQTSMSIAALCGFKISPVGVATISDRPIRYDFATKLISVKDAIMAIEGVTSIGALRKIQNLKNNNFIVISEDTTTGYVNFKGENNHRILGARIVQIAQLCAHLNGTQARAISRQVNDDGVRVQAGDKSLHAVINENGKRVDRAASEGDVLATALVGVRRDDSDGIGLSDGTDDSEKWVKARALEGVANRQVIQICRDQRVNSPSVQNSCSQAVLGYDGSATNFKQQNGIAPHVPLQDVMDISQIGMRMALTNVVGKKIVEGDLTSKEGEKCAKECSADFGALCQKYGISGLKPLGNKKSFASAYHAVEAKKKKITRKQLRFELREEAETETRNATSLSKMKTNTVSSETSSLSASAHAARTFVATTNLSTLSISS